MSVEIVFRVARLTLVYYNGRLFELLPVGGILRLRHKDYGDTLAMDDSTKTSSTGGQW